MIKAKPVGAVAEREKMPFEVTPFMFYLTRTAGSLATPQNNGQLGLGTNTWDRATPSELNVRELTVLELTAR